MHRRAFLRTVAVAAGLSWAGFAHHKPGHHGGPPRPPEPDPEPEPTPPPDPEPPGDVHWNETALVWNDEPVTWEA